MNKYILGVIQMDSTADVDENLHQVELYAQEAVSRGAKFWLFQRV